MNPEERYLLERSLKLAEENNTILRKLKRIHHWAILWGFVKIALIIVPLVIGYLFLEPYLGEVQENYQSLQGLLNV